MATKQDDTQPVRLPEDAGDRAQQHARSAGGTFEIRVMGHLDSRWSDWLGSMRVQTLDNGEMVLTGSLEDQAALMGVIDKLHRLNLRLVSINPIRRSENQASESPSGNEPGERREGRAEETD
jgi:hypothetical protein